VRRAGAGDGGFLMSISDLETAIRLGLRMCILIYNDSSYAAEVHYFRRQGFSIDISWRPELSEGASLPLELGRRSHEVPLAELDATLTQDVVGGRGMKIEVRQAEVQQQRLPGELALAAR
jgi:Thiamine pyrophosphate enzyme, C-terminal TPP binding domain